MKLFNLVLILTLLYVSNLRAVEPNIVGSGINFGGSTLASHETGSFSPAIVGSTGGTAPTMSTQLGTYVKIGSVVFVQFNAIISAKNAPTGKIWITGLPFVIKSGSFGRVAVTVSGADNLTGFDIGSISGTYAATDAGEGKIFLANNDATQISVSALTNSTGFNMTATYITD